MKSLRKSVLSYKNYLVAVLLVILAFNFVDRFALGILLQDIKVDLELSDTQLGLLSGLSFAIFYSIMGMPIARWADRGNRVTIIAATTALWSATVALCGLAGSLLQLMLIRVGVAVGEAGCMPTAHSLIADYFSRSERPRIVAIYMLGWPLGMILGYFVAGWLNELYGWRVTFIVVGLPGLALSALSWFTLREPRLAGSAVGLTAQRVRTASFDSSPTLAQVFICLWGNITFRYLLLCYSIACFFGYGVSQWQPAFFIRSFGLETGELGTWLALIWGVGGAIGTYWGGELASRFAAHNEPLQLRVMAWIYCSFGALSVGIYVSPTQELAFWFMGLAAVGVSTVGGPLFATIQMLVPNRMRATAFALVNLLANLIGMGLGPLATGGLSDAFRPWAGEDSLRYALLALCPGYLCCGWLMWLGSRSVRQDLDGVQLDQSSMPHELQRSTR